MRGTELLDKMELVEAGFVEEADVAGAGGRTRNAWVKWAAVAACLCIAVGVVAVVTHQKEQPAPAPTEQEQPAPTPFALELSDKTTAKVELGIVGLPEGTSLAPASSSLLYFTEEEMFALENQYIFRGTVRDLTNITIDFGSGDDWANCWYRCIATIDVSKVYKGDISAGSQIRMLLPFGAGIEGVWVEDTGTISNIKVGMEGIFMPNVYDGDSIMEAMGKVVMLQDLASCGLGDGERWAFLSDGEHLIYADWAYPGASGSTLDDIEAYVLRMLDTVS